MLSEFSLKDTILQSTALSYTLEACEYYLLFTKQVKRTRRQMGLNLEPS